jgi:glycosyltransferase involved in cell wall biosynthesis
MSIKKIIYPTQGSPFSETFVKAEMELLKNSGVIVEFIDVNALPISITNIIKSIFLHPLIFVYSLYVCFKSIGTITRLISDLDCTLRVFSNIKSISKLYAGVTETRCHFIAKRATFALIVYKLFGYKYTLVAHAADIFGWNNSIHVKVKNAYRVDCISNYNRGYLDAKFNFKFSEKLSLIRNAFYLNSNPFSLPPPHLNEQTIKNTRPYRFLYIGRFVKKKNLINMIEMLDDFSKCYSQIELVLIGAGGDDELNVKRKISGLKHLVVKNLGYCDSVAITKEIKLADFVILLSSRATNRNRDQDGIPTIFLESLALGTPVISTQVSGIPELVVDQFNGVILESTSAIDLYKKLNFFHAEREKIITHFKIWYQLGNGYHLLTKNHSVNN